MTQRASLIGRVILILVGMSVPCAVSAAEEKPIEFYLQEMKAARNELKSGKFICTGTRTVRQVQIKPTGLEFGRPTSEMPIYFKCSFAGESLQFDYSQNGKPNEKDVRIQVIDPRFIGVIGLLEMELGKDMDWLLSIFKMEKVMKITSGNGMTKISWDRLDSRRHVEGKRTIHIDTAHGFTPTRLEHRIRPQGHAADWSTIPANLRADVKWKLIRQVWVPVEVHYELQYGEEIVIHKLDWKEINKAVLD